MSTKRGKLHFWTREVQDQGHITRCGLRMADRSKTTTARERVTCQRCRNFLDTDRRVTARSRSRGMY